jgi:plastocyanin
VYRLAAVTVAGLSLVALVVVLAVGAGERPPTRRPLACGIYPSSAPVQSGTPQVASPPVGSTVALAPRVGVVGAWASCFRPEVVTIKVAEVVQWQQIDYYSPVVALDNGLEFGPVRHILEVRFNRPGRYSYHAKSDPNAAGTVVVEGQAGAGPELEVWSEGQHRAVSQATALADGCAVTLPTGSTPPGVPGYVSGVNYGNGKVWVSLYPEGRVDAGPHYVQPDGSIDMKFGWWRGVHGTLVISGRRLDSGAPPARSYVPEGYGDQFFQASGISFPTPGCWEITGTVGNASLTFVTMVVRAS